MPYFVLLYEVWQYEAWHLSHLNPISYKSHEAISYFRNDKGENGTNPENLPDTIPPVNMLYVVKRTEVFIILNCISSICHGLTT